jgi:epidermal growth factor receptor substrate 15
MEFSSLISRFLLRCVAISLLFSSHANAFSLTDYLAGQNTGQIANLFYFLFGVLTLLLIMPILQFYLAEVRSNRFTQQTQQYQGILDSFFTGIIYVDSLGKVAYVNPTAIKQLGRSKNDILNSSVMANFDKSFSAEIKKGLVNKNNGHSIHAKGAGKSFVLHFGKSIIHDEKTLRVLTIVPDNTAVQHNSAEPSAISSVENTKSSADSSNEAQSSEALTMLQEQLDASKQALAETQSKLEKLLELAPVAIATIDADHKVLQANHSMQNRLKYSEKELKKGTIYNFFSEPAEAGIAAKSLKDKGYLHDFHAKLKGKDGNIYPGELSIDATSEDKNEFLFWLIDRGDEEFQRVKFESLLQHSSMPMAILEDKGFSKLNQSALEFFSIEDEDDLFGVFPSSSQLSVNDDDAEQLARIIEEVKADGKVKTLPWKHQIGEQQVACEITFAPVYKDHEFDFILCMWTDLRELQKMQDVLKRASVLHRFVDGELSEKQKMLRNAQEALNDKSSKLIDTEQMLNKAQEDLVHSQSEFEQVKQSYDEVSETLQALEEKREESVHMLDEAKQRNTQLNQELEAAASEVLTLREQRQKIADEVESSQALYQETHEALAQSDEQTKLLKAEKQAVEQELQELISLVDEMREQITHKDKEIQSVNEEKLNLEAKLESTSSSTSKLQEQLEAQKKATEEALAQHTMLEKRDGQAQAELDQKMEHVQKLEKELEALELSSQKDKEDMQSLQARLQNELDATLEKLSDSQASIDALKSTSDQEILDKKQHDDLLKKLNAELDEIKSESQKQKQVINENEETWLQRQQETETHRNELQDALSKAESQNKELQESLAQRVEELKKAESAMQENQSEQQKLQEQLEAAQLELKDLQAHIASKETESNELIEQLQEQQRSLEHQESDILEQTQEKQKALTEQLATIEAQYAQSEQKLAEQNASYDALQQQLQALEQSAAASDQKLIDTSNALSEAEKELKASKEHLKEQEAALVAKHKQELEEVAQQNSSSKVSRPEIERLPLPEKPEIWFNLLVYLQGHPPLASLPQALNKLMDDIEEHVSQAEVSIMANDLSGTRAHSLKLLRLAEIINSDPLVELMHSVENDCRDGMVDNVSIRWPSIKVAFQRSLRAVYAHLNQ